MIDSRLIHWERMVQMIKHYDSMNADELRAEIDRIYELPGNQFFKCEGRLEYIRDRLINLTTESRLQNLPKKEGVK